VVVVEHDMDFVRRLGCRVTVLHEGRVLAEGSLDHVVSDPAVIDVYSGAAGMLEARGLTLRYGQSRVLHGVDLDARAGGSRP
jgi:ABC-type branched-subunit amino acid transport system ATPase component